MARVEVAAAHTDGATQSVPINRSGSPPGSHLVGLGRSRLRLSDWIRMPVRVIRRRQAVTSGIPLAALLALFMGDSDHFMQCLDGVLAARRVVVLAAAAGCHHLHPA